MKRYNLNHLQKLEAESLYAFREVTAQFERPTLLFSGGKDSIVLGHLAKKAFSPAKIPFSLQGTITHTSLLKFGTSSF